MASTPDGLIVIGREPKNLVKQIVSESGCSTHSKESEPNSKESGVDYRNDRKVDYRVDNEIP
jgi:hypothetical protein